MPLAAAAAAVLMHAAAATATDTAVPQSPFQLQRFQAVASAARAASAEATPALEAALSGPAFRLALARCCPHLVGSNSSALLKRLVDEVAVLEVVTGFPAADDGWDFSLATGTNASWLLNQWEVAIFEGGSAFGPKGWRTGWFKIQDDVETKLYGLRPFATRGQPSTRAEAMERGAYTLLNAARSDMGSPLYGDVSAVVRSSAVREALLVSAIDTGEWTGLCNSSTADQEPMLPPEMLARRRAGAWPPSSYKTNCTAYNFTLGTLDDFHHLVLANDAYWKRARGRVHGLARLLELLTSRSPALVATDLFTYWEGVPAS